MKLPLWFSLAAGLLLAGAFVARAPAGRPHQELDVEAAPGEAALGWLRRRAIPFATTATGHGFADLQPLEELIGDARIVALGEGTHGTREFFQMKHRVTELLASEMGFTLFAIEAKMPESYRVNEYVLTGKGDPRALLHGMHFWTWNTQEVLAMIEWMRAFNRAGKGRIQFLGFDMQYVAVPAQIVRDFVAKAEPGWSAELAEGYARVEDSLRAAGPWLPYGAAVRAFPRAAKDALAHLEAGRQRYLARFPREEVDWAIQNARIVAQAVEARDGTFWARDWCMAKNVEWILDQAPPGAKIVLWAHNAHVSRRQGAMGSFLGQRFGKEMVVLGFAFDRGTYTAVGDEVIGTHEAPPAIAGSVESYLRAAGLPRFIVDLRGIPAGSPAAPWLVDMRPFRSVGARAERSPFNYASVARDYDGLIWIGETSHSVSLPLPPGDDGRRPRRGAS